MTITLYTVARLLSLVYGLGVQVSVNRKFIWRKNGKFTKKPYKLPYLLCSSLKVAANHHTSLAGDTNGHIYGYILFNRVNNLFFVAISDKDIKLSSKRFGIIGTIYNDCIIVNDCNGISHIIADREMDDAIRVTTEIDRLEGLTISSDNSFVLIPAFPIVVNYHLTSRTTYYNLAKNVEANSYIE
jgi:hypothetical protein